MVLVIIDGVLSYFQPIVVPTEIKCRGVAAGNIKPYPVSFAKDIAGWPNFDFKFIYPSWFDRLGVCMRIVGTIGI